MALGRALVLGCSNVDVTRGGDFMATSRDSLLHNLQTASDRQVLILPAWKVLH